jgi:hypothetical protein
VHSRKSAAHKRLRDHTYQEQPKMAHQCPAPYSRYTIAEDGAVYMDGTVRQHGHMSKVGYVSYALLDDAGERHIMLAHRFAYWAYNADTFDMTHEVDHIDRCPQNNAIANLQALSKEEHNRKTAGDNPNRFVNTAKRPQKVQHVCANTGKLTPFASVAEASTSNRCDTTAMLALLSDEASSWTWVRTLPRVHNGGHPNRRRVLRLGWPPLCTRGRVRRQVDNRWRQRVAGCEGEQHGTRVCRRPRDARHPVAQRSADGVVQTSGIQALSRECTTVATPTGRRVLR